MSDLEWTEWGVRRTWGDVGSIAYFERDRLAAEEFARSCAGEVVVRTVSANEWATR